MIDKTELKAVVEQALDDSELFVVDITVSTDNVIEVSLDGMRDITLDDCMRVDKAVHAAFDQDAEDYELTVGSYGLTSPFKVQRQYVKNIGQEVETLTNSGLKMHGTLTAASDHTFTITVPTKVKVEGKKRPEMQDVATILRYDEVKYTKCEIKF